MAMGRGMRLWRWVVVLPLITLLVMCFPFVYADDVVDGGIALRQKVDAIFAEMVEELGDFDHWTLGDRKLYYRRISEAGFDPGSSRYGLPGPTEIQWHGALDIAVTALKREYALTEAELDRLTAYFDYYPSTCEPAWRIDLEPTRQEERLLPAYSVTIDAHTGEIWGLSRAESHQSLL